MIGDILPLVQQAYFCRHLASLLLVAVSRKYRDASARFVSTVYLFLDLVGIVLDNAVGRADNRLRGAVILFQLNNLGLRKLCLETEDIVNVGTAKGIDALRIIAHDTHPCFPPTKLLDEQVLRIVRVLILVHQDAPIPPPVLVAHLSMLL